MDPVAITTALSTANDTIKAIKVIMNSDDFVDKASLKLNLAEALNAQYELMEVIRDQRDEINTLNNEIESLHENENDYKVFKDHAECSRSYMYLDEKPEGMPLGPYCLDCWLSRKKIQIMLPKPQNQLNCSVCKIDIPISSKDDPLRLRVITTRVRRVNT